MPSERWLNAWAKLLSELSAGLDLIEQERLGAIELLKEPGRAQRVTRRLARLEWSDLYELPFSAQMALSAVTVMPILEVARLMAPWRLVDVLSPDWLSRVSDSDYDPPASKTASIARHASAMLGQLRALKVAQRSMSSLVRSAKRDSDDPSLFLAIRIDPAVVTGPTARARIHRAIFLDEPGFLTSVTSALRDPINFERDNARLNLALWFLDKTRQLKFLNEERAEELFIKRTRFYPSKGRKDARRSLWRLIQRWKADNATNSR